MLPPNLEINDNPGQEEDIPMQLHPLTQVMGMSVMQRRWLQDQENKKKNLKLEAKNKMGCIVQWVPIPHPDNTW